MQKSAIVVHSGGMDSSLCLALASNEFGAENVLSMSFDYEQRHSVETNCAEKICQDWGIDNVKLSLSCLQQITDNALLSHHVPIATDHTGTPNTLVMGRNGLMARLAAIHANSMGAQYIYLGVIEVESANSGYRDCSRKYMDLLEQVLRIDLDCDAFEIRTPIIKLTKKQTLQLAYELGILKYLLLNTVTCYDGIMRAGCDKCPACILRNLGLSEFSKEYSEFELPYQLPARYL